MAKWPFTDKALVESVKTSHAEASGGAKERTKVNGIEFFGGGDLLAGLWLSSPSLVDYGQEPILDVVETPEGPMVVSTIEEGNYQPVQGHRGFVRVVVKSPDDTMSYGVYKAEQFIKDELYGPLTIENVVKPEVGLREDFRIDRVLTALAKKGRATQLAMATLARSVFTNEGIEKLGGEDQAAIREVLAEMDYKPTAKSCGKPHNVLADNFWVGVLSLPDQLFEAVKMQAAAGWHPIIPQWQTLYGHVHNHAWENGCYQGMGLSVHGYYGGNWVKMVSWVGGGHTLHSDGPRRRNQFPFTIPQEWADRYTAMATEIAQWPAISWDDGRNAAEVTGLLLSAVRNSNLHIWTGKSMGEAVRQAYRLTAKGFPSVDVTVEAVGEPAPDPVGVAAAPAPVCVFEGDGGLPF